MDGNRVSLLKSVKLWSRENEYCSFDTVSVIGTGCTKLVLLNVCLSSHLSVIGSALSSKYILHKISPVCNLSKRFENNRASYDWCISMSAISESFVSMWLSSQILLRHLCSSLAVIGETMGWGSVLLRTVPVCQIPSLHPALPAGSRTKTDHWVNWQDSSASSYPRTSIRHTHTHTCKFKKTHWHANTQSQKTPTDTCMQKKMDRPSAGSTPKTATVKPHRTQMCSDTGVGNALSSLKKT